MPLQIGGFAPNVSPLLDQQRYQEEQLRRAAEEAQQLNMQQATHTANVGSENFQYHQQQDALARHAAELAKHDAYTQQRDLVGDTRHQQEFDREGLWHGQKQAQDLADREALTAHHAAVLKQQQDQFALEEQRRQEGLAETARNHAIAEKQRAEVEAQRVAHEAGTDLTAQGKRAEEAGKDEEKKYGPTIESEQHLRDANNFMDRAPQVRGQVLLDKGFSPAAGWTPEFPGPTVGDEPTPGLPSIKDVIGTKRKEQSAKDLAIRNEHTVNEARQEAKDAAAATELKRKVSETNLPFTRLTRMLDAEPDAAKRDEIIQAAEAHAYGKLPKLTTDATGKVTTGNSILDDELASAEVEAAKEGDSIHKVTGLQVWRRNQAAEAHAPFQHAVERVRAGEYKYQDAPMDETGNPYAGSSKPVPPKPSGVTPAASGAAPSQPVKVTSQAQYDALPNGASYIDSTGATKVKGRK